MLTAGARLRGSAKAQRELVAELDGAGVAALGLGIELVFKRVPPALLSEAERRVVPGLRRPAADAVPRDRHGDQPRAAVRRAAHLPAAVLDAALPGRRAARERPAPRRRGAARRAARRQRRACCPATGAPAARRGRPAAGAVAGDRRRPTALHELDVDGWHAIATPVLDDGRAARGWLIVAGRAASNARLTKPVAQAAAPLLAATARLARTERAQTRAIGAGAARRPADRRGRHARAGRARRGARDRLLRVPARVVVARGIDARAVLGDLGVPYLATAESTDRARAGRGARARCCSALGQWRGGRHRAARLLGDGGRGLAARRAARGGAHRARGHAGGAGLRGLRARAAAALRGTARAHRSRRSSAGSAPCASSRCCGTRSSPTSSTTSTSVVPQRRCTCTRTRCAIASRASRSCSGRSLKQPSTIASLYVAMLAD